MPTNSDMRLDATGLRARGLGGVDADLVGEEVAVAGWVHRRRDLGGMVFLDLRDRSGILQVSVGPDWSSEAANETAHGLGAEDVVRVRGIVRLRPEDARNPDMATGDVEVQALEVEVLNEARTPPIPVYRSPEEELPSEELRLRHRVLDLRRSELQARLEMRHKIVLAARTFLDSLGFLEIETPILTKPTPEGARDFLVPSRVHPGEFFALPQSPQIYKQLLMISGFDRYFQIARCFRDEDLRADRQPEFTQIDVEASFVEPDDILRWMEGMMEAVAESIGAEASAPFQRMAYADALERYGIDRPDLRYELEICDISDVLGSVGSNIIDQALAGGGRARGLVVPGGAALSRKQIEGVEGAAKKAGAPGLMWAKVQGGEASGPLGRFFGDDTAGRIGMSDGDLLLVGAGADKITSPALAAARAAVIEVMEIPRVREHAWLWVMDFPLFEETDTGLTANHHPFVYPHPEDMDRLDEDPLSVRGLAYDLVYNGVELGSGSIRCHQADMQRRILRILGLEDDVIDRKFGFLLEALRAGAPPHGGIALGVDRLAVQFSGAQSLRDVIAFPKTTAARALYEGAPAPLSSSELEELGLALREDA